MRPLPRAVAVAVLACLAAFACKKSGEPVAPPAQAGMSATPRFDGVYAAQLEGDAGTGLDLLRFTADGRVFGLSTASPQALEAAAQMLVTESDRCSKGTYDVKAGVLRFVLKSKLGSVEYAGAVHDDKLLVRWQSAINDVSMETSFDFIKVVDDAPDGGAAPAASGGAPDDADGGAPAASGPPDPTLIPEGTVWYCFRAKGASRCERKLAACDSARKRVAEARKDMKLSRCAKQTRAFCFTAVQRASARGAASCSASEDDCKADLAGLDAERSSGEYTVSTCARQ